jgi:hypothetical protein
MKLTGEYPPIVKAGGTGPFFDLMAHALGAAGLSGAEAHAYEAARQVRREKDIQQPSTGEGEFLGQLRECRVVTASGESRLEGLQLSELYAMGKLKKYRRPRPGPKSVQKPQ